MSKVLHKGYVYEAQGKPEYYAVVLDEKSRAELLSKFASDIPSDWKKTAHHMTILHMSRPNIEIETYAKNALGNRISLTVEKLGISNDAIAVRVRGSAPSANAIPHITLAIPPKGKAFNSNKITDWQDVNHFDVFGEVTAVGG